MGGDTSEFEYGEGVMCSNLELNGEMKSFSINLFRR